MGISPRAIAVDGVGYKPSVMATFGFGFVNIDVIIVPSTGAGSVGGGSTKKSRREKIEKIIFKVRFKNKETVKEYIVKKSLVIHIIVKLMNIFKLSNKTRIKAKEIKWN
jgi:hypothetical protein